MAITKEKKKEIVGKFSDILKNAKSLVFVAFRGFKVAETTAMRKALKGKGIGYVVAKKTLLRRALEEKKIEGSIPELSGEIALVYGDDLLAPAREINLAAKTNKDNLSIVGGIFEGKFIGREEVLSLASIPTREILYGQFANLMISPIQRFVIALSQVAEKKV